MNTLLVSLRMTVVTLGITGIAYPLAMTALSQLLFPAAANGSFVFDEHGRAVGSELIAQSFSQPGYFQPRPSAAGDHGFDAMSSSASNLGPTSLKLKDRVAAEVKRLRAENPDASEPIPTELVTTSGSGLDPHLSPEAAMWQVARIAKARGVTTDRISNLVAAESEARTFGILGEPRVNVLQLNLAMDRQFGHPP